MQLDKDAIYGKVREVFFEQFEIASQDVTLDARLYDDLDIDSIDAVNLVIELQKITGRKVLLEELQSVKTVSDVVDLVVAIRQEQHLTG